MKYIITHGITLILCFILQATVFRGLSFAGIVPNILVIAVAALGFMHGEKTGLLAGFFAGLLMDVFFGDVIGMYALIYMYIGFLNGKLNEMFYPESIRLPLLLILASDLLYGISSYTLLFLMRNRLNFGYYFMNIIVPEMVYTLLLTLLIYPLMLFSYRLLEKESLFGGFPKRKHDNV